MLGVLAVRKVQPEGVYPRLRQRPDDFQARARRPERGDDLRSASAEGFHYPNPNARSPPPGVRHRLVSSAQVCKKRNVRSPRDAPLAKVQSDQSSAIGSLTRSRVDAWREALAHRQRPVDDKPRFRHGVHLDSSGRLTPTARGRLRRPLARTTTADAALLALGPREGAPARVDGLVTQLLLDAKQLVVLGDAIGAAGRAGLDLACASRHGEIGDGRILGLSGAVRDHRRVAVLARQLDAVERLGERADLVQLDQDRVGDLALDTELQALDVGHEDVVADKLELVSQLLGYLAPALPVVLGVTVFDRDDREALDERGVVVGHLARAQVLTLALEHVATVLEDLTCSWVERDRDLRSEEHTSELQS